MKKDIIEKIMNLTSGVVNENEPMSRHTFMRVGGNADLFIFCDKISELINIIHFLKMQKIPFLTIGEGSNIIVRDRGIEGAVIKFCELSDISFHEIELTENSIKVPAFMSKRRFLEKCAGSELGGTEFLVGIPGTIGGGIIMNAGTSTRSFSNILKSIEVYDIDSNERKTIFSDDIIFGYREMIIDKINNFVILSATIRLEKCETQVIVEKIEKYRKMRRMQPREYPNAGSIFKNPTGLYSGELIEKVGLKGYSIGGASVSEKHANFIVNYNNAKACDVIALIEHIKVKVKKELKIDLTTEVQIVGRDEIN